MKVREMLITGNRNFSPCNVCDVNGSLIGSSHADVGQNFKRKINK